jgi:hypothetical protein
MTHLTLDQSQQLQKAYKKAGVTQPESEYWFYDCYPIPDTSVSLSAGVKKVFKGRNQKSTKTEERILMIYSAPTLEEMLEAIPASIEIKTDEYTDMVIIQTYWLEIHKAEGYWELKYSIGDYSKELVLIENQSLLTALCELLIYLLDNNYIK